MPGGALIMLEWQQRPNSSSELPTRTAAACRGISSLPADVACVLDQHFAHLQSCGEGFAAAHRLLQQQLCFARMALHSDWQQQQRWHFVGCEAASGSSSWSSTPVASRARAGHHYDTLAGAFKSSRVCLCTQQVVVVQKTASLGHSKSIS